MIVTASISSEPLAIGTRTVLFGPALAIPDDLFCRTEVALPIARQSLRISFESDPTRSCLCALKDFGAGRIAVAGLGTARCKQMNSLTSICGLCVDVVHMRFLSPDLKHI